MTAEAATRSAATPVTPDPLAAPAPRLARAAGILYLALFGLGMFAPIVLEQLLVPGDASATAIRLTDARVLFGASLLAWVAIVAVDVAISVIVYLLLAPVSRAGALTAAGFRLVYSAVLGSLLVLLFQAWQLLGLDAGRSNGAAQDDLALAALEKFSTGFQVALVLFGLHLVLLGVVLHRSRWAPRVLSAVLVAAGVGYGVNSLASLLLEGFGGAISAILLTPAVIGEVGLAVWLLVQGASRRAPLAG